MVQHLVISEDRAGQRIDNFLFSFLKGVPKSRIYKALRKGEVRVNGSRVKPTYRLCEADKVRLPPLRTAEKVDSKVATSRVQRFLSDQIILEDDRVLVVDKPSGMPVHGGTGQDFGVLDVIKAMRPTAPCLELVHRLDKGTSGCLVLAKKRSMLRYLHALLRQRSVKKQYLAVLKGRWPGARKKVDYPLHKYLLKNGERRVRVDRDQGRTAISYFTPLMVAEEASLVLISIETGRTHQIRVHAAALGYPIAGDDKYGDPVFNQALKARGLSRLFLHAASISFLDSELGGSVLSVGVGLPKELKKVLVNLELDYFCLKDMS